MKIEDYDVVQISSGQQRKIVYEVKKDIVIPSYFILKRGKDLDVGTG